MKLRPPRWTPTFVVIALFALAGGLRYAGFLSWPMLCDLAADQAVLGLAAIGAAIVLVSGAVDLSVGALMALSSVAFALLVERAHWAYPVAAACVLVAGTVAGLAQGALIAGLGLPAFIVTLSGLFLFRGLALQLSEESVAIADPAFVALTDFGVPVFGGRVRGAAFVLGACALVAVLAMRQSRSLRAAYALGGDARAARLAGIPVQRTRLVVFALSGLLSALAGLVFALVSSSGSSIAGAGLELDAIASCVVGGVALTGGRGTIAGALSGVLLFGILQDWILFEGTLDAGWTRVAMGTLLLLFVALERVMRGAGR